MTIDTVGSTFNTTLGVYTGTMVSALRRLEQDFAIDGRQSRVTLQVADGSFSDGTFFRTTISLASERSSVVNCHLILYGMDADFGAGRESSFPMTVPAYGVMSVRTTGAGRLQSGYATVGCDRSISGQLTYATYDASGNEPLLLEVPFIHLPALSGSAAVG